MNPVTAQEDHIKSANGWLSVVIPTLNEGLRISRVLESCLHPAVAQRIVADGGSHDQTRERARESGAKVIESAPGRGIQQNAGAAQASGEWLLFLHADCLLPEHYPEVIERAADAGHTWGAFRLQIDSHRSAYRRIERWAAYRSRAFHLPFGDQALFVTRKAFIASGGFAPVRIMEDMDWCRRMAKHSPPFLAHEAVTASARQWERRGVYKQSAIHLTSQVLFLCGMPSNRLARWCAPQHEAERCAEPRHRL